MTNILVQQLAENLRAYRAGLLLSKAKLSDVLGSHRTYLGRIEKGGENVSLGNVVGLAERLGVHPIDLLRGELIQADMDGWAGGRLPAAAATEPGPGEEQQDASNVLVRQFVANLRAYRARRGISQEKLSLALDRSRSYIGRIERAANPTLGTVAQVAGEIDVHPMDLLDGEIVRADRRAWEAGRSSDLRAAADGDDPGERPKGDEGSA